MQLQCGNFLEIALLMAVELVNSLLALVYLAEFYDLCRVTDRYISRLGVALLTARLLKDLLAII